MRVQIEELRNPTELKPRRTQFFVQQFGCCWFPATRRTMNDYYVRITHSFTNLHSVIAILPLNGPRAENHERFNAFSATYGADLKVNWYINYSTALMTRDNLQGYNMTFNKNLALTSLLMYNGIWKHNSRFAGHFQASYGIIHTWEGNYNTWKRRKSLY